MGGRQDGPADERNERTNERTSETNKTNERETKRTLPTKQANELNETRCVMKRNETKQAKCSYLPLVATHADQNVHKFLKAWRVSSVSELGFSVVHDVFSGPLRNLFSTQHQLQFLWRERTKLLHRKHRVKPVWKINMKINKSQIQQGFCLRINDVPWCA